MLPADERAQRRASSAATPAVRDPDSRLRRPLVQLLEELGGSSAIADQFVPAPRPPRQVPLFGQLRGALTVVLSAGGGTR